MEYPFVSLSKGTGRCRPVPVLGLLEVVVLLLVGVDVLDGLVERLLRIGTVEDVLRRLRERRRDERIAGGHRSHDRELLRELTEDLVLATGSVTGHHGRRAVGGRNR